MKRLALVVTTFAFLTLAGYTLAGGTPSLLTASGNVVKVEKDEITVQPRAEGGKFGKNLTLKVTGTSKITVLSRRKQAGKTISVQNELQAKDLQPNQHVAVIYTSGAKDSVLLSAVALPATSK
jgi:hypothetical protein